MKSVRTLLIRNRIFILRISLLNRIILFSLLTLSSSTILAQVTCISNGEFRNPSIWSPAPPTAGQYIIVNSGVTLSIDSITPQIGDLIVNGSVVINNTSTADLVTGGNITVNTGASLTNNGRIEFLVLGKTFFLNGTATYTHNPLLSDSVDESIFYNSYETFSITSNLIIQKWNDGSIPLGDQTRIATSNFGNLTLSATVPGGVWDQDGNFAYPSFNRIRGLFTVSASTIVMDDGTGNTNQIFLGDVLVNGTGSLIFQRGYDRDLAITAGNFTVNSSSTTPVTLLDSSMGILTFTLTGNLSITSSFTGITGSWGQLGSEARVTVGGNLSINGGNFNLVTKADAPAKLTVNGNTTLNSTAAGSVSFLDGGNYNLTFITNDLIITSGQNNYLFGRPGSVLYPKGSGTFTINNNLTINGNSNTYVAWSDSNTNKIRFTVGHDATLNGAGALFVVGNTNGALTFKTSNLYTQTSGRFIGQSYDQNLNTDSVIFGGSFLFNSVTASDYFKANRSSGPTIVNTTSNFTVQNSGTASNQGVICVDSSASNLTFTVGGNFVQNGGLFCGIVNGSGNCTFNVTGIVDVNAGNFTCLNNTLTTTSSTITFTANSIDYDGGYFNAFNTCNTSSGSGVFTITSACKINFASTSDFFSFIGLAKTAFDLNNLTLNLQVGGSFTISGANGTFISSQSLGAETISVGSFNVSAGNNSFNTVQGTTFGNGHSVNFTVTGNVAISGGTTFFSAATQGVTLTVNGDFTLSGGTASVKGGDNAGTSVVNILGAYNQSNGNFYLHNAPTDELNTGAIITMTVNSNADNNGDFTHTGGTFTYDNSATTPSTLTLSLVIKSPNYTLGGSGLITMTKAGTGNVYGNLSFARTGTIAYTRTGTHNIQQVLQTIQDNCTLDMVSGDLIVSSNNNSRGTFPDWFNIFPNGVLNMRTNSIQSNRLNTFSGITVLGRLKLQHTNGMYNGTVNAALATNITDNFDYYLSSGSTVEYNGVDNQIITGMGIGKALLTNHKYFNLAINFTGTADAEFVYPTNSPNDSAVQVRNSVVLTAGELNLDNDHNPSNGGGRMIVIENSAVTAISRTSGYIRSEVENGSALVKWTMNTVAGNHIIPFGYNSTTYIPLTATVSSGSAANFYAGTYRTSSANLPLPPTVTHIQNGSGTNISPICVDRYWYLNTTGTPTMNMNYTFSSTEAGSITSFNAIRWITAPPSWTSPPPGTQTPGTLSVQANGLSTIKNWWTVSGNIQLTITASAGAHGSISPNGNTLVNFGANQTFNITADPCYTIADVIVDGVSQGAISSYTFTNVIVNHAISASFNQINYPVNASAGSNGSISSPGITNVPCGTNITYTITPAPCYSIANVIVDGVSQGIISSYTFTNVTTSHSISATFAQINYSITASAGSNGSISPSGISNLACGSNQTYLINANSCYSIADVLVDGVSQGAISSYTFNTIGANHTISASFTLNTYVLSGTAGSHGTISPSGISTVNCGSDFTYTITPDLCYIIDDVLVDGVSQGAIISYTFSNVTTTHNISASFTRISYTITASAGANGSISPNGANTVLCGNDQTFTITPNSCYAIDDVVVDGVSQGAITSYTFTNTSASHTISATFVQLSYSITSSAGPNGSITPLGTSTVLCGNDQSYSITPDPCFAIEDVIVDGVSQGAISSYTFSGVTTSHSISATFVQITYTITASAGAHGSISPNGISTFNCGTDHTYNITADPCYEITDVLVDGVSQGVISSYTFTSLSASHTINVTFNQITYTISASAGSNGSISPNGANTVLCGNDQTFTITPNACYAIDDVVVDGVSQGAITSYTFTNTSTSHTISATFVQLSYSITSSAGPNGSITPLGTSTVLCGNDQSYSITPDPCFAIEDVIVDGVSQGAINSYTFSGVTSSHSISATFVQITYTITASAGAHGSISPNGISTFNCGTDHTYNITADPCYEITEVLVDGVSQGVISAYTFTSLSASHTISVTFNQITYTITASAGPNGSISPNGANTVLCGNDQTFTITPNPCYAIDDVLVDGVSQGAITSYTFTNTSSSHTISATFVQLSYSITSSAGPNGSITPLGSSTVLCGNDQSYSITPDPCFAIEDVIVDGVSQGAISSYTFSGVTTSHTISATFVQITYTITASAGAHGSISPNGISTFNCGTDHTYNITADPCYEITDVLVDGVSQGAIASYTFTSLSASHVISVTFNQITYTITASTGPNGSISPNGANTVLCGNDQTFTITPNPCYAIDDVIVDGVSQGAITSYTFTNTSASHTISATFVQLSYSITSSAGPNGSITPLGTSTVLCGNDQSYSITPDPCFAIEDVIVDGVSQGAISSYTFSGVTTSHSISATFVQITYTITASAGVHGSISPNGISTFNCGTDHTYNITADPCYEITDVLVDGVSQGAIASYTFTSLSASHTISVTFHQITYTITASAGPNGSISPNGANTVLCGNDQTFTITPNSCYAIDDVLVDGVSQGAITSYTFTNTSASHTISATFVQLSYSITSSAGSNGSITPLGTSTVLCGNDQSYSITPDPCFAIEDVIVDGVSQGAINSYTFSGVTSSHSISASFVLINYTIVASAGVNGSISPSGSLTLPCGSTQLYTITPDSSYLILDVLVNGVSVGAVSSYTFNNLSANSTIYATFIASCFVPTISCSPNVIEYSPSNSCSTQVFYPEPVVDGTSPDLSYTFSGSTTGSGSGSGNGSVFELGTTLVTIRASNLCGIDSCSFTVQVIDTIVPIVQCQNTLNVTADAGACEYSAALDPATATDNCTITSITYSPPGPYPVGTTLVTWTATDNSGNTSSCLLTINVSDSEFPTLSCPADFTTYDTIPALGTPIANDNCGILNIVNNAPAVFPIGITTVVWTATDVHGNSTTCNQIVTVEPLYDTLALKVFFQGYYIGSGTMNSPLFNSGLSTNPDDCDTLTVCLIDPNTISPVACFQGIVSINGNLTCTFPSTLGGSDYYIQVKHRNALETWSASPVTLLGATGYDFTQSNTQAYAYNMTEVEPGVWAFWSGDISDGFTSGVQDGIIESGDYSQLENAANTFIFGYDVNDITGDGLVESSDYSLVENNIVLFLFSLHP